MNRQHIFDEVVVALVAQGRPSMGNDSCMYRGPNGTRCAIGALIPEELYSIDMENRGVASLLTGFPEVGRLLSVNNDDDEEFLQDLQNVHDNGRYEVETFIGQFVERARIFAHEYTLDDSVFDRL